MQLQLDHYNGRLVEKVESTGDDNWDWGIFFEGGAVVKNKDGRRTALPNEIVGQALAKVEYNDTDTQMVFGNAVNSQFVETARVVLTPTQYTIADPASPVAAEEEIYPQADAVEPAAVQAEQQEQEQEVEPDEEDTDEIPRPEFPVPPTPEPEEAEEAEEEEDEGE